MIDALFLDLPLTPPSLAKIAPNCQSNSPQAQIADWSSTNALSFSSACTTKRFPSRCASASRQFCSNRENNRDA